MDKKAIGVLLVMLLGVDVAHGAAERQWRSRSGPQPGVANLTQAPAAAPVMQIIVDPLGDHITFPGLPIVDIVLVEGGADSTNVTIKVTFSAVTVMNQVVGWIDLDTDQNNSTGAPPVRILFQGQTRTSVSSFSWISLASLAMAQLMS